MAAPASTEVSDQGPPEGLGQQAVTTTSADPAPVARRRYRYNAGTTSPSGVAPGWHAQV